MKINPISFRGATININALSDVHGCLNLADRGYQALMNGDNFEKEETGKENFLIIGGDWFISGGKKGYKTDKNKPLMEFQGDMLNKFLEKVKEKYPKCINIFCTGNHEFDGGIETFTNAMKNLDADVIISNLDFENSEALKDSNIVSQKITMVQDDKNPDIKHAVLNIGTAPVNLDFYAKNHSGVELIENCSLPQKFVTRKNTEKTRGQIKKQVENFKKEYPDGIAVLTCHSGVNLADDIAKETDIDLAFDAHEHKDETRFVNGVPIIALSKDFEKIANAKIKISDDGKKEKIIIKELRPFENSYEPGELSRFYEDLFKDDIQKNYTIKSKDNITLDTKNIRNSNNNLANFVTDIVLDEIKEIDPSVQIFALNASAVRSGFEISKNDIPAVSPLEVSNCLKGINQDIGGIMVNEVKGSELAYLVLDNFEFNSMDTEKNPIIHYSGISVNKTDFMKAHKMGADVRYLCRYIKLSETNEPVDPDKTYKIANVEKYFNKSNNPKIKELKNSAEPLNANVHELFEGYFEKNPILEVKPRTAFY